MCAFFFFDFMLACPSSCLKAHNGCRWICFYPMHTFRCDVAWLSMLDVGRITVRFIFLFAIYRIRNADSSDMKMHHMITRACAEKLQLCLAHRITCGHKWYNVDTTACVVALYVSRYAHSYVLCDRESSVVVHWAHIAYACTHTHTNTF
jgi:hypothetical protein